jgi:hypothetical protein
MSDVILKFVARTKRLLLNLCIRLHSSPSCRFGRVYVS